jgi:histidinol dehydrogenase
MKIISYKQAISIDWQSSSQEAIDSVRKIIFDVKKNGDKAVKSYNKKFDKIIIDNFEVSKEEIADAYTKVDSDVIGALKKAAANIKSFAEKQMSDIKDLKLKNDTIELGHRIVPIQSVGCYVPGGQYPLPSTALMSVIPARVAGVKNVFVFSPKIQPVTIVAADIAGADKIYKIGGVQAIAAMAFGTKQIPKVDKIVGPGNKYVAAAKKEVFGTVGIDMIAGPSEVLVIADDSANPAFIAADLLAQAEHDIDARANLITLSKSLADKVQSQIKIQLSKLSTKDIAVKSIKKGNIILVDSLDEAIGLSNLIAPEHLELQIKNPEKIISQLVNYGSLFIGEYSAEVFGDYCSGPNHTLPTGGAARYTGGLSVKEFVKTLTYQKALKRNDNLINISSTLAKAEGLDAHRNAAEIRKN